MIVVQTHCPQAKDLGAAQLTPPNVPGSGSVTIPSGGVGHGNIRGVAVMCPGLGVTLPVLPLTATDATLGVIPVYWGTLAADLVADGWIVHVAHYPEIGYSGVPSVGLQADVLADTGKGARYKNTSQLWDEHVLSWKNIVYGPSVPLMPVGFSWGGWHALALAQHLPRAIAAYVVHCPVTYLSHINPLFAGPTGSTFAAMDSSGLDLSAHALDGVSCPGFVSYGTNDIAVGYNAAGTGGTPISNTDAIITNAVAAGQPVTRNATTDNHELLPADNTSIMAFVTGTVDPLCPKAF